MGKEAVARVLTQEWFRRPVLDVAPELLGTYLVTDASEAMITEVEAYDGPEDKACHAHRGMTQRTKVMFGPAGHWYVYLCYGMYWMLNIVTGEEGYPAAVLIRGVTGAKLDGPGKLTKAWAIDGSYNGKISDPSSGLWIEDRGVRSTEIERTPRIGVDYAGEWAAAPYRFVIPATDIRS